MSIIQFNHREPIGSSTYPMPNGLVDLKRSASMLSTNPDFPTSTIYIHIPFCDQICSFCGFNKSVSSEDTKEAYVDALIEELQIYAHTPWISALNVPAVYIGGGTPNSLSADQLSRILSFLHQNFPLAKECEITCEGTPMNFTEDRIAILKHYGVKRVSAGIQTFNYDIRTEHLQMREGKEELLKYIERIASHFDNFNLDMIFNMPRQTDDIWQDDLETVLDTPVKHLTIYPLVLLEHTIFYSDFVKKGKYPAPEQDREMRLFNLSQQKLQNTSFATGRYTVRDWAHPGYYRRYIDTNAHCNHVLAFGAGAHGFLGTYTYRNVKSVKQYVDMVKNQKILPYDSQTFCSIRQIMERFMVMGLRLINLDLADFDLRFGEPWQNHFGDKVQALINSGFIELDGSRVKYTAQGYIWANNIRSYFEHNTTGAVGYSDTRGLGKTGKDHYSSWLRVKATDAETT
jgi:oxygen-independent coproporphyrinogen III oxidase